VRRVLLGSAGAWQASVGRTGAASCSSLQLQWWTASVHDLVCSLSLHWRAAQHGISSEDHACSKAVADHCVAGGRHCIFMKHLHIQVWHVRRGLIDSSSCKHTPQGRVPTVCQEKQSKSTQSALYQNRIGFEAWGQYYL